MSESTILLIAAVAICVICIAAVAATAVNLLATYRRERKKLARRSRFKARAPNPTIARFLDDLSQQEAP
jgi:hypothetical protein